MQVDFELDLNSVPNSTWGRVQLDPEVIAAHLGEEGGYVNVATESGWAVVNMPVPPATEPPLATYFHLDAEEGDALELVAVRVQHSRYPIADISEWADDLGAFEVEDWLSAKGGVTNEPTEDPGLPPLTVPVGTAVPVGQETYTLFQPVTNVQCAESQCIPMAVANCLQFLEDGVHLAVPYAHVLGLKGDNTLVGVLDGDFSRFVQSRSVGDGSSFIEAVDGTFKWLRESLQETSLTYRHQDRGWGTVGVDSLPGGNYTKHGVTSVDDGALVTANWLEQRVRDGCAVVAVYHESTGGRGHVVERRPLRAEARLPAPQIQDGLGALLRRQATRRSCSGSGSAPYSAISGAQPAIELIYGQKWRIQKSRTTPPTMPPCGRWACAWPATAWPRT